LFDIINYVSVSRLVGDYIAIDLGTTGLNSLTITLFFTTYTVPTYYRCVISLGYNDVSWHNPDILTPNMEALASSGIILNNSYTLPMCTPTRAALMTGYYPIHTGRQVRSTFFAL
jgi:hypothetical protein